MHLLGKFRQMLNQRWCYFRCPIAGSQAEAGTGIHAGTDTDRQVTKFHTHEGSENNKTGRRINHPQSEFAGTGVAAPQQQQTPPYRQDTTPSGRRTKLQG